MYERQQARGLSAQEVPVDVKTKICTLPDSTPFSRHLLALIRRFHCGSGHAESCERCISAQDADSTRKKGEEGTYVALQNTRESFALCVYGTAEMNSTRHITGSVVVLASWITCPGGRFIDSATVPSLILAKIVQLGLHVVQR